MQQYVYLFSTDDLEFCLHKINYRVTNIWFLIFFFLENTKIIMKASLFCLRVMESLHAMCRKSSSVMDPSQGQWPLSSFQWSVSIYSKDAGSKLTGHASIYYYAHAVTIEHSAKPLPIDTDHICTTEKGPNIGYPIFWCVFVCSATFCPVSSKYWLQFFNISASNVCSW